MVVASSASWWLTALAVGRSARRAIADSGTIVVALLLTGWPVAWSRNPGLMGPLEVVLAVVDVPLDVEFTGVVMAPAVPRAGT